MAEGRKRSTKLELEALYGETLALQVILTNVLRHLRAANPALAGAITAGLNEAANEVEDLAIHFGKAASPEHSVKAIRIVEELRAAILGNKDKPRSGI